jgi:hypothetical protein
MNQGGLGWILLGIATLGLAAVIVIFGSNMLPASESMQGKLGTIAPLVITWGMIWITVVMSIALAIYVFAYGLGKITR